MDDDIGERYADRFGGRSPEEEEAAGRAFGIDPTTIVVTVVVTDADGRDIGHAALRRLGDELEIKRVFITPASRGTGASRFLMGELERIARELGASRLILQTGDRQPEAVALYERLGYTRIAIFDPYTAYDFSLCYEKVLAE